MSDNTPETTSTETTQTEATPTEAMASGGPDLTDDERLTLTTLPSLIGSAVAFSSRNGAIGTVKEMMANAKSAAEGRNLFPDNELIQSILPNMDNAGAALDKAKAIQAAQVEKMKAAGVESADDMRDYVLNQASAARDLLADKIDGAEAAQYKEWVLGVADAVAKAAKEGGFLGIGGEQVTDAETDTIAAIKTELGD